MRNAECKGEYRAARRLHLHSAFDTPHSALERQPDTYQRPASSPVQPHLQRRERLVLRPARLMRRSEEHTSELQSQSNLVCRLLLEKKKKTTRPDTTPKTN